MTNVAVEMSMMFVAFGRPRLRGMGHINTLFHHFLVTSHLVPSTGFIPRLLRGLQSLVLVVLPPDDDDDNNHNHLVRQNMLSNDKTNRFDEHKTPPNALESFLDLIGANVTVASTSDIASSSRHDLSNRQRRRLTSKKRRQLSNLDSSAKTTTIDDNHDDDI